MIVSGSGRDCITVSQPVLPNESWRNPRIPRLGQVAVGGPPDKSAITRRLKPADRFAVGNYWLWGSLLLEVAAAATSVAAMPASISMIKVAAFTGGALKIGSLSLVLTASAAASAALLR
jgi:hypothetical protein